MRIELWLILANLVVGVIGIQMALQGKVRRTAPKHAMMHHDARRRVEPIHIDRIPMKESRRRIRIGIRGWNLDANIGRRQTTLDPRSEPGAVELPMKLRRSLQRHRQSRAPDPVARFQIQGAQHAVEL